VAGFGLNLARDIAAGWLTNILYIIVDILTVLETETAYVGVELLDVLEGGHCD
jgi:hypothetical protein